MSAQYVRIKVEVVIKHKDIIDAMKELNIKINKKNEQLYTNLLKKVTIRANEDFAKCKNEIDKETLLMYGFTFD